MKKTAINISGIPALVWGEPSARLFIAVHGAMSNKADTVIEILAQEAEIAGAQVLSFDLPQHGERKDDAYVCKLQNCMRDLRLIMAYAEEKWSQLSLFACSMGAYFSLQTWQDVIFQKCLFLSPMVDMGRIIDNMMTAFNISEERLKEEQTIPTPVGETLYWDVFSYVREHTITHWTSPTAILCGSEDEICEVPLTAAFAKKFACEMKIMQSAEHYFHTDVELQYYCGWLRSELNKE